MMAERTVYNMAEVKKHQSNTDVWMVISEKVYDISKFLNEHPGGEEVLHDLAGQDATNSFEDVGHSSDAREMMKTYEIGDLDPNDCKTARSVWSSQGSSSITTLGMLVPVMAVVILGVMYRYYLA